MSETTTRRSRGQLSQRLLGHDAVIFYILIAVVVISMVSVNFFASTLTVGFLLIQVIPILLIAMPMGLDIGIVIVLSILIGVVCGAFNGFLITTLGLPSLAVTIGTLALYRGLALVVIGDQKVASFPKELNAFVLSKIGNTGIPVMMIFVLIVIAFFAVLLHFTPFGRGLYALGYSPQAATFVGVRVGHAKFWLFVGTGVVSSMVGVFLTLRLASAGPDNGTGLELSVIAAVLLGGVSIFGGKGNIPGVVGGVLLIGTLTYALRLAKVPETALIIVTGGLLVLSVVAPSVIGWAKERIRLNRMHREVQGQNAPGTTSA